jgi:hypothetical protein
MSMTSNTHLARPECAKSSHNGYGIRRKLIHVSIEFSPNFMIKTDLATRSYSKDN